MRSAISVLVWKKRIQVFGFNMCKNLPFVYIHLAVCI